MTSEEGLHPLRHPALEKSKFISKRKKYEDNGSQRILAAQSQ
jgi:hypothetical protein